MAQNPLIKRYLDAGMAFTQMTQSRAEAIVQDLVKAGEVQAAKTEELVTQLVERSRRNTERLLELVRTEVRDQIASLNLVSEDDLAKLEQRLGLAPQKAVKKAAKKKAATKKKTAKKKAAKKNAPTKKKATGTKKAAKKKATGAKKAAEKAPGTTKASAAGTASAPTGSPSPAAGGGAAGDTSAT